NVKDNALRLSLEQPTRKPFYLVGRLGDRDLSISAQGSGLSVKLGDEEPERIDLPKEDHDEETITPTRIRDLPTEVQAPSTQGPAAHIAASADAELAGQAIGHRRSGAAALSDDPQRAQRRAASDRGSGGSEDIPADLLSAGEPGGQGHAFGAL